MVHPRGNTEIEGVTSPYHPRCTHIQRTLQHMSNVTKTFAQQKYGVQAYDYLRDRLVKPLYAFQQKYRSQIGQAYNIGYDLYKQNYIRAAYKTFSWKGKPYTRRYSQREYIPTRQLYGTYRFQHARYRTPYTYRRRRFRRPYRRYRRTSYNRIHKKSLAYRYR